MPDIGHVKTDELIKEMETKVAREYNQARLEVQRKLNRYMAKTAAEAEEKRLLFEAGEISKKDYTDWMMRKTAMGKRWEEMRDNLAEDYHHANQISKSIIKGYQPEVYALNHNYATYQIEHDGGIDSFYSLYDKQTVERLIREDQVLMPDPSPRKAAKIAANKDMQWNKQQLQSALTQSILQGESIPEMAKRISETVAVKNYNAAVRYARTMSTGAENAGRYDAYRRAEKMGIDLTIEWCATLDHRTRHDHRMMHGQRTEVDKPFLTPDGYTIYYPADCTGESTAPQHEIWNCRCTLLAWVKGFERDTVKESPKIKGMTFEEWQHAKEPKGIKAAKKTEPVIPKFIPAKTRQEAEEYERRFAETVKYSGVSLENANKINEQLTVLTTKYPIKKLDHIIQNGRQKSVARACYDVLEVNGKTIGKDYNAEGFKLLQNSYRSAISGIKARYPSGKIPRDMQKQIDKYEKLLLYDKWSVCQQYGAAGNVTHEYGHIIADQYWGMLNEGRAVSSWSDFETRAQLQAMRNKLDDVYKKAKKNGDIYKLSHYGSTNKDEFFAEAFTAREFGETLPDYINEIVEEIVSGKPM